MHISNLETAQRIDVRMDGAKGVSKQIPIAREHGTPAFSFRVFTIEPGGHTPLHTHPFEHLNYIIEGSGAVVTDTGERALATGDFVLVLPHERHQYRNTSPGSPLVMLCAVPKEYE